MFKIIQGIKFGRLGVLVDYGTRECFYTNDEFDIGLTSRIGCRVNFQENPIRFFHFKHLRDAIDFMEWMAGVNDEQEKEQVRGGPE